MAAHLRLHWRELVDGHRVRRAALKYRRALAADDPLESFQHAFAGLEILERLLAAELGIPPGSEIATTLCPNCGTSIEYKKTVLVAVRAFVQGFLHDDPSEERAEDWRLMNRLRNDVVHGLQDADELEERSRRLIAAVAHYLHDASVHLGHLHQLEVDPFRLSRVGKQLVFSGEVQVESFPELSEQRLVLDAEPMRWVVQNGHGILPEYQIANTSGGSAEGQPFLLEKGFMDASEDDLVPISGLIPGG